MSADHGDTRETQGLMERVRAGDRQALDHLFRVHAPYLRRVVDVRLGRRLRRRMGVSDVMQATQVDALERIETFFDGEPVPFRLWLRRVAQERVRRAWREHMQAAKRDLRREVPLPDRSSLQLAERLAARGPTPSQVVSRKEMAVRVREALAELSEADCEVLLMRDFEGLPYEEIAYVLGVNSAALRKRRGRALMRLGAALREHGIGGSSS